MLSLRHQRTALVGRRETLLHPEIFRLCVMGALAMSAAVAAREEATRLLEIVLFSRDLKAVSGTLPLSGFFASFRGRCLCRSFCSSPYQSLRPSVSKALETLIFRSFLRTCGA